MNVQINVGQETTISEYRALATFFNQLGNFNQQLAPSGDQPLISNEFVKEGCAQFNGDNVLTAVAPETTTVATLPEAGSEKTKRTRRTKAEIEAEATANAAQRPEVGADKPAEAGQLGGGLLDAGEKIDTATGEITKQVATDNGTAPVEEFETAGAAGGKTYTEAEVQNLASSVARVKGPQIVKDKITELGATRIAALTADQLNSLGAYLETQK